MVYIPPSSTYPFYATCYCVQVSLCHLTVLSLKSCKLRQLGEDVAELGCLRELYLESNFILNLPEAFTRLRALEVCVSLASAPKPTYMPYFLSCQLQALSPIIVQEGFK